MASESKIEGTHKALQEETRGRRNVLNLFSSEYMMLLSNPDRQHHIS